jgi:RNA polymerase sigma factor (sigma-70 family)
VEACRAGDERAWAALIHKYRPLILSVPRRFGASPQDAADVFQTVCVELIRGLPRLQKSESVRSWLLTVASHESARWKQRQLKRLTREVDEIDSAVDTIGVPPARQLENQELAASIRTAVAKLPARQQELVRMLFFHDPPLEYGTVASRLGLATGSVGFMRARCLNRLRRLLSQPAGPMTAMRR